MEVREKFKGSIVLLLALFVIVISNGCKTNEAESRSVVFDGVDDYVVLAGERFTHLDAGSFSFWFKPQATIERGRALAQGLIVKNRSRFNGGDFWIGFSMAGGSSGRLEMAIQTAKTSGTMIESKVDSWSSDQWHHAAFTFDAKAGVMRSYVNGALDNELGESVAIEDNSIPLYIGANQGDLDGMHYFKGKIAEVRIFNRALDQIEIRALYLEKYLPAKGQLLHLDFAPQQGEVEYELHGAKYDRDTPKPGR